MLIWRNLVNFLTLQTVSRLNSMYNAGPQLNAVRGATVNNNLNRAGLNSITKQQQQQNFAAQNKPYSVVLSQRKNENPGSNADWLSTKESITTHQQQHNFAAQNKPSSMAVTKFTGTNGYKLLSTNPAHMGGFSDKYAKGSNTATAWSKENLVPILKKLALLYERNPAQFTEIYQRSRTNSLFGKYAIAPSTGRSKIFEILGNGEQVPLKAIAGQSQPLYPAPTSSKLIESGGARTLNSMITQTVKAEVNNARSLPTHPSGMVAAKPETLSPLPPVPPQNLLTPKSAAPAQPQFVNNPRPQTDSIIPPGQTNTNSPQSQLLIRKNTELPKTTSMSPGPLLKTRGQELENNINNARLAPRQQTRLQTDNLLSSMLTTGAGTASIAAFGAAKSIPGSNPTGTRVQQSGASQLNSGTGTGTVSSNPLSNQQTQPNSLRSASNNQAGNTEQIRNSQSTESRQPQVNTKPKTETENALNVDPTKSNNAKISQPSSNDALTASANSAASSADDVSSKPKISAGSIAVSGLAGVGLGALLGNLFGNDLTFP